jgi:hypothetical protein
LIYITEISNLFSTLRKGDELLVRENSSEEKIPGVMTLLGEPHEMTFFAALST